MSGDKNFSEFPPATVLNGADLLAVYQGGTTKGLPASVLIDLLPAGATGPTGPEGPQGPPGTGVQGPVGQSDFLRGALAVPGALFAPYYQSDAAKLTLACIRTLLDAPAGAFSAFSMRAHLDTGVAETAGAAEVARGETFSAYWFDTDDADFIYVYDTIDNADGGTTGRLGKAIVVRSAAGCWPIKGEGSNDTIGWISTETGFPGALFDYGGYAFSAILESRDFAVSRAELVPGFSFEIPFRLNVGGAFSDASSTVSFYALMPSDQDLFPVISCVTIQKDSVTETNTTVSGFLRMSVSRLYEDGGADSIQVRTSVIFDDLAPSWHVNQAQVTDTTVLLPILWSSSSLGNLVRFYAVGANGITNACMIDSYMTVAKASVYS